MNGQNVPRTDNDEFGIRNFYRAPDGKVLYLIDYSGFELRLMAWKSGDEVMTDAFKHGGDLHRKTASTLTGKPESEITKHERSNAKSGNFGISYGGTEYALQETLKGYGIRMSLDECLEIVKAVKATYPRIPEYQRSIVVEAREQGYVETIYGYKRLLPNINSTSGKARSSDERRASNTPIQGSAADVMKRSQLVVYEKIGLDTARERLGQDLEVFEGFSEEIKTKLEEPPVFMHGKTDMIAQIHDEIIFQFDDDPDLAKKAGDWVKAVMEIPPLKDFPIGIEAEASAAYSWGNKKDFDDWLKERKG
jgi:DNA polymerase-1